MWCSCWTWLTLLQGCHPTGLSLLTGPCSHSVPFPSVGPYRLLLLQLPWQQAPGGSGRWCVWTRSGGPASRHAPHRQRLPSTPTPLPPAPSWAGAGRRARCFHQLRLSETLARALRQEPWSGGRVPQSWNAVECCREQSKLKSSAAWLSSYNIRQAFLRRSHNGALWRHKSKKIAAHRRTSIHSRTDVKTSQSQSQSKNSPSSLFVCHPAISSCFFFWGRLVIGL